MRELFVLFLAFTLSIPSVADGQVVADQFLIVPAKRIGPIKLGMSYDEVKTILGLPQAAPTELATATSTTYQWSSQYGKMYVRIDKDKLVARVSVYLDVRYATAEGIRAGSTLEEVFSVFKGRGEIRYWPGYSEIVYQDKGIIFNVENPVEIHQVAMITVCVPRKC